MARKKRTNAEKCRQKCLTSRLLCSLLYACFWALVVFLLCLIFPASLVVVCGWMALVAVLLSVAFFLFWVFKGRRAECFDRVHTALFLSAVCGSASFSFLWILCLGKNGAWVSALMPLFMCALYFVYLVFPRYLFWLGICGAALSAFLSLYLLAVLQTYFLARLLFTIVFLSLVSVLVALLLWHQQKDNAQKEKGSAKTVALFVILLCVFAIGAILCATLVRYVAWFVPLPLLTCLLCILRKGVARK